MSTMVLDTFFEPISTCKNFDTNQNARVFSYSLQRSPALQDAASHYLFDLKQKNGIESDLRDSVIDIIAAIAPIAPKALTLVMPALADDLKFDDSEVRSKVVSLLGKVFSSTGAYVSDFPELLKEYLGRINDKIVGIRSSILSVAIDLVKSHPSTMPDVCAVLVAALNDGEEKIRKIALNVVCENFKLLQQSGDATILKEAGKRMRDTLSAAPAATDNEYSDGFGQDGYDPAEVNQAAPLSRKEFADALGCSKSHISYLWSGGMPNSSIAAAKAWRLDQKGNLFF